jgi:putative ABC transport system permease protein
MKLSKNIVLSAEILAAHKLRTLLSVLGIVVGVGAVVLMVSAARGAEKHILDRIRGMGSNLLIVNAGQTYVVAGRQRQMDTVRTLLPADAQAIAKECPSVALAAAVLGKKLTVRREDQDVSTLVVGMGVDALQIRSFRLASGREFDEDESRAAKRVAILGPTTAVNLFGSSDPMGLQIRIRKVPFEVIGVTAPKGMDINGQDQDDLIIVPLEAAMRRIFNLTYVQTIYAQASTPEKLYTAEKEISALLEQRHRLAGKRDDFTIQNQTTLLAAERETSGSMTLLIGSVAAISLVVGGIGILAVMLMTVRERTPEIGLRRALGAKRRDIRTQFLVESSLLSGFGGLIGVIGSIALTVVISALGYWDAMISWPSAAVGFFFSVSVGILFGLYPAIRAARMEPIHALRSDMRRSIHHK